MIFYQKKLNKFYFNFYLAVIEVYSSPTTNAKNTTSKLNEKNIPPKLETTNFDEYNDIIINILKNMNSDLLSKLNCF